MKNLNLTTILFVLICSIYCINAFSQEYIEGTLWVNINENSALPQDTTFYPQNTVLQTIFSQFDVESYRQAMPFAKNPENILNC